MKNRIIFFALVIFTSPFFMISCDSGDLVKPVITLTGNADTTISLNANWKEPGYKAVDDQDGIITTSVVVKGSVNKDSVGVYTLTYTVADAGGNRATQKRTITVRNDAYDRIGSYSASIQYTYSGSTSNSAYVDNITCSNTQNNVIIFDMFGGHKNCHVKAAISKNAITIPAQTLFINNAFITFATIGTGTISGTTFNFNYSETDINSNQEQVVAIYSKN